MPIRVECPTCRAAFRVGEDQAGRRGKCPRCKTAIEVPAPDESDDLVPVEPTPTPTPTPTASPRIDDGSEETYGLKGGGGKVRVVPARAAGLAAKGVVSAAEPTRPTQTPAQILAAFRGEIEPVRPTPLYRFWVVIVAGVMILLPLVYIAIIGLLVLGLGLLAARFPDGPARREEARALYPCAAHLGGRVVPEIPLLVRDRQTLVRLLNTCQEGKNSQNQALINACLRAAKQLHDRLESFRWKVGDTLNYPFEHAHEDITLARFALPAVPAKENVGDLLQASEAAIERLMTLYRLALGPLALTAEEVERALGLPPIEIPKADEIDSDRA